jgi:hypothetical protein
LYRRNLAIEDFNKNPFNLSIKNRFTVGKQIIGESSGEISAANAMSICTIVNDLVSNKKRIVDDDTEFMGKVDQTDEQKYQEMKEFLLKGEVFMISSLQS